MALMGTTLKVDKFSLIIIACCIVTLGAGDEPKDA